MAKRLRQRIRLIAAKAQHTLYLTMYLANDESQNVRVRETKAVNFSEIKRHLDLGESVFITKKTVVANESTDSRRGIVRRTIRTLAKTFPNHQHSGFLSKVGI